MTNEKKSVKTALAGSSELWFNCINYAHEAPFWYRCFGEPYIYFYIILFNQKTLKTQTHLLEQAQLKAAAFLVAPKYEYCHPLNMIAAACQNK